MLKPARVASLALLSLTVAITASAASQTVQTIAFDPIPNQIFGVSPFVITAKASSGLPVTFASTTPGVCKTSGGLVMLLSAGPCFITASQAGNGTYSSATATQSFTVGLAKLSGMLTAASGSPFAAATSPSSYIVSGDFNGDGVPDFAIGTSSGVRVFLGTGTGGFTAGAGSPIAVGALATGDFDGDGVQDLAGVTSGSNSVTVLLGNGAGGFAASTGSPFAVGTNPGSVVVGDFNGDGIQDLGVANSGSNNVTVLLGTGAGGFTAATAGPFSVGSSPESIVAADFNGDGVLDIATANLGGNNLTVLLGNGSGGFTQGPGSPFNLGTLVAVALGDFNGDGIPDLAAVNIANGHVAILLGTSSGGFNSAPGSPFAVPPNPNSVAVGDFNGDGIQDLAVTSHTLGTATQNFVTIYLGNGSGGFSLAQSVALPTQSDPGSAIAGDFNGDGFLDIALTNSGTNNFTVFLGGLAATNSVLSTTSQLTITAGQAVPLTLTVSGSASAFSAPTGTVTFLDGGTVLGTASQSASPYTFSATGLSVGSHMFSANYGGGLGNAGSSSNTITIQVNLASQTITFGALSNVSLGVGTVTLTASATSGLAVSFVSTTTGVCTVAGNVVTLASTGTCSITASQAGSGIYAVAAPVIQSFMVQTTQTISFDAIPNQLFGGSPFVMAAQASSGLPVSFATTTPGVCINTGSRVMLRGAGTCSITAAQAGNATYRAAGAVTRSFTVSIAKPAGTLVPAPGSPFTLGHNEYPRSVATGDFNGDGIPDLVVANNSNNVSVLLGDGTGGFSMALGSPFTVGTGDVFVLVGDFNGDGIPDIVTVNSDITGSVSVLLGNGTGGFSMAPGSPFAVGLNPTSAAVGDFNGDGIPDVAVSNSGSNSDSSTNSVTVLLGNGSGGFTPSTGSPFVVGHLPTWIVAGDFNGDGFEDLATANYGDKNISLLLGNGHGGFTAGSPLAVFEFGPLAVGDFNGDGIPDLVQVANNSVTVLPGNGTGGFGTARTSSVGGVGGATYVVVGDFNGDGIPDLAVSFEGSNAVEVLLGNGAGYFARAGGSFTVPGGPFGLVVGDFNGDGITDLATPDTPLAYGDATVLLGGLVPPSSVLSTASSATITFGQAVPLSLAVSDSVTAFSAPTGTTTFSDGGTVLGAASQNSSPYTFSAVNLGVGSHTLTATYGGGSGSTGSSSNTVTIQVNPASQTISFGALSNVSLGAGTVALTASAVSGLTVSFASTTTGVCTVVGNIVTLVSAGNCSITASQAGGGNYAAAASVVQSFMVLTTQTISFDAIPNQIFGGTPFVTAAQASSGLAVTFTSDTPRVCKTASNLIMLLSPGTCSITASQAGNGTYGAATPLTKSFTASQAKPVGTFSAATGSPFALPAEPAGLAIGDFTGNGIQDLVVSNSRTLVLLGNGSGGFSAGFPTTVPNNAYPHGVAVGDFNGDGFADIAIANNGSGNVTVLLGNGSDVFNEVTGSPFSVGLFPGNIVVGDFNGDGIQDLVTGTSSGVAVLLGNGSGGFTAAPGSPFAAGLDPYSVAAGDFNGDGIQDIAVADAVGNNVTVLLGNGSGGFTPMTGSPFSAGTQPVFIVVADFNGDGIPDLATANELSNNITVWLGKSSGGFTTAPGSPFAVGTDPESIAVGDFNGDGVPDLAIANAGSNDLTVLFGNGSGGFTTAAAGPFAVGTNPDSVVTGDFNGDGVPDLATANYASGNVTVLLGAAVSTTSLLSTTSPLTIPFGQSVPLSLTVSDATAAFNAPTGSVTFSDGAAVLGTASQNSSPYTFIASNLAGGSHTLSATFGGGSGSAGSSSNSITIQVLQTQTISFGAPGNVLLGSGAVTLSATASSGLLVLFTSNSPSVCTVSGVSVTLAGYGSCSITASQAGNSTYAAATPVTQVFSVSPVTPSVTSVTPNTVAAGSLATAVTIAGSNFVSGATVSFTPPGGTAQTITPSLVQAAQIAATIPAAFLTTAGTAQVAVNNGVGAFSNSVAFTITAAAQTISFDAIPNQIPGVSPFVIAAQASSLLPVSFASSTPAVCKNSGDLVVLVSAGTCSITASQGGSSSYGAAAPVTRSFTVSLAKASGSFMAAAGSPFGVGTQPVSVATGDFNRDGIPDLVVANSSDNNVVVLLGDGVGGFAPAPGSPFTVGSEPESIAVGDFNGDGIPDLAVANSGSGSVTVLFGNGSGAFTPADGTPVTILPNLQFLTVGDFNGDGIQDLVAVSSIGSSVAVMLGNGSGGFTMAAGSPIEVVVGPTAVAVGDFNGDGVQDLAVTSGFNGVAVFLGNGSGAFTKVAGSPFAVGPSAFPEAIAVGDFNGDGFQDIVTDNFVGSTSSSISVLLGNGSGGFTVASGIPYAALSSSAGGLVIGDFNGDGIQDLATTDRNSNVMIMLGNGRGGFAGATGGPFAVGTNPMGMAVGDFNGDGIEDLATANSGSNNVTVLLGAVVGSAPQAITFGPLSNVTYGSAPTTISATASSSLSVTFSSATVSNCIVAGTKVTIVGAGTCLIVASQVGNGTYAAAATVTQSFMINQASQTISWGALGNVSLGSGTEYLSAYASSGLEVSFTSTTSSVCTLAGSALTFVNTGTCSVTASQTGNSNFAAATPVTQSISVLNLSGQPATCTASANAVFVRAEGTAEQIADTTISCAGGYSGSMSLTLYLSPSVNITSAAVGGVSEIVAGVNATSTTLAAGAVHGVVNGNSVTFSGILFPVGAFTVTITNIKVNASTVSTSNAVPTGISETIFVNGTNVTPSAITTPSAVAYVTNGLTGVKATGVTSEAVCVAATAASPGFNVQFAESFPNAFKVQGSAPSNSLLDSWFANHTETGYGVVSGGASNTASSGTRVKIIFNNIPANVTVYVPVSAANNGGVVTLTGSETGVFSAVAASTASGAPGGAAALPVSGGSATAIYETTSASSLPATFTVPVYLVANANSVSVSSAAMTATVSLAPIGAASNVPSFINGSSTTTVTGSSFVSCAAGTPQTISFGPLSNVPLSTGTVALTATASSGLAVSLASNTPGVCTVASSVVALGSTGACSITASQAGNSTYAAATPVTQTFTVTSSNSQTISFGALGNVASGTAPFAISATASSGLPVSFTSTTSSVCSVSGSAVTIAGTGTCSITASQAGNATYLAAASVTRTFSVVVVSSQATCTASANAVFARAEGTTEQVADTTLSCTGGNALPMNITLYLSPSVNITSATLAGGVTEAVAGLNASSTTLATGAVNGVVSNNSVSFTGVPTASGAFTLTITNIKINASTLPTTNGVPIGMSETLFLSGSGATPSAISTSGAVAYVINGLANVAATGVISYPVCLAITSAVPGFNVQFGEGFPNAFKVQGSAAANSTLGSWFSNHSETGYGVVTNSASSGTRVKILFNNIPANTAVYVPVSVTNSGGSMTLISSETGAFSAVAASTATGAPGGAAAVTVVGGSATVIYEATTVSTSAATYSIPVYVVASAGAVAPSSGITVTVSLAPIGAAQNVPNFVNGSSTTTVYGSTFVACGLSAASQSISFASLGNTTMTAGTVTLTATATSGLAVGFSSNSAGVCTVAGNTATLKSAGTCSITASQAGDSNYAAAAPVTQTFLVGTTNIQTITFGPLVNEASGAAPFTVSATASSGLAVSFVSTTLGVCTVSGTTVTIAGTGTCSITASQAGNSNYLVATPVTQSFSVVNAGAPATCNSANSNAVFVRAEGMTEQVADTIISCTGGNGLPVSLTVYLSPTVNITSATVGGKSEALAGLNNTSTTFAGVPVSGVVSGNSVTFNNVPTAAGAFTLTITNIKVNASMVATSSGVPTGISETIFLSGTGVTPTAITTGSAVAYVTNALSGVAANGATSNQVCSAITATSPLFSVQFAEAFPNAFKVKGSAAVNSIIGSWYTNHSETGYGVTSGAASNTATSGTRVKIIFGNIPSGTLTMYVPVSATNNSGVFTLTTSETGAFSAVPASTATGAPAGTAAVAVVAGSATVIYETTAASTAPATYTIPVYLAAGAGALAAQGSAMTATVSLAPIGAANIVPNFINGSSTTTVNGSTFAGCGQTITFGPLSNVVLGTGNLTLTGSAGSGLGLSFASTTQGVCTVAGNVVTPVGGGTCSITASQAGGGGYLAAAPVTETFTVSVLTPSVSSVTPNTLAAYSAAATVSVAGGNFGTDSTVYFTPPGGSATAVSASLISAAQLAATIPASLLTTAGTAEVFVGNGGSATLSNQVPFTITTTGQTISFDAISNQIFGVSPFVVAARASSGLPVSFSSTTPGVCKVADSLVMLLGVGNCSVTVGQGGNAGVSAATPVTRSFAVAQAKPSGTLTASLTGTGNSPASMANGDFNGDGIQDLAVANSGDNTVTVLLGNGTGGFAAAGGSPFPVGTLPNSVVSGDFNGDGNLDLAVANYGDNTVTVLLGNGAGAFTAVSGGALGVGAGPRSVAVGDFNGDGIQDLVTANEGGNNITVLLGNGLGGFAAAGGSPFGAGTEPFSIVVGDFNGDGIQDIATANIGSNNVTVLLGNGSGGFTQATGSPFAVGNSPVSLALGDVNGDGVQDIMTANAPVDSVSVLLGNGSGGFTTASGSPYNAGLIVNSVAVGDFNGDGIQDIAAANDFGVAVLLGNGSGSFSSAGPLYFTTGRGTGSIVVADFNGDGIQDLATANKGSNNVSVLLGNSAATNSVLSTTSALSIPFGQSVPLSLAVSDSGTAFSLPTGTATLSDGATVLGSATQTSSPYTFTAGSLGVGSHILSAAYGGDSRTAGSVSNSITVQVTQAPQTITFGALSAITLPASTFSLTGTTSSGLTVSFASTTTSVCTVSGTTVTPLAAGTCSITASQAGNANYLAATSVTQSFTINPVAVSSGGGGGGGGGGAAPGGGSALTVSPGSVTISASVGGSPGSASVTLSYQTQTQGAPSFSSNFNTNQGQGWISVSPASGTMTQASYAGFLYTYTATVSINGDPTGIAGGSSYTGTVNFSSGGGIVSVPVTMNVSTVAAKFTVAPSSLSFSYQLGNAGVPATQSIAVFSTPTGAGFTATASSTGGWLSVGSSGTTPGAVAVSVNVGGLAAGTYSGSVVIGSLSVPVSLTVLKAAPPVLSVSPSMESLSAGQSGGQVTVSNAGGGTLDFSASSDQGWLIVGAGSGSAVAGSPASLPFGVNSVNLTPGVYTGHIAVSDENSSAVSTVTVVLTVSGAAAPSIRLSNTGLTLTGVAGGLTPQAQSVVVSNSGAGSLNWSAQVSTTSGGSWLVATPGSGTISVSANTAGLAAGVYYGSVNVVAANASNSPQMVSVVLNLLAASVSPGVSVSTGGVLLVGSSGQTVGLYNAGSSAISYTAGAFANGGSWLTVSPASGMVNPGANSISIAANLSGLTGVQSGSVTLAFGDGSSAAIQVVALGLGAVNARTGEAGYHPAPQLVAACAGGKAGFLIPVFRQPANGASVQVAGAATLQVQMVDDCGNAVTSGSVQVTFGNGDSGINLNSVGSGVWEATWVPANVGASVVLTVAASENGLTANSSLSALSSVTVSVLAASANAAPQPTGIANAASAAQAVPEVVAPGSYVAIYGTGLAGSGNPAATTLPLPTTLNGTQMFLGGIPMPLLYAGSGQVNALVPQGIAPNATYPLVVVRGAAQSVPVALTVTELQPGAYTVNTSGSGAGIVTNAAGVLNSGSNPAHAGDYLVIYATGLGTLAGAGGQTEPSDGSAAPSNIVYSTTAKVSATIGGVNAPVLFSGLTATFAGLYQVNLQVPAGVVAGSSVPLVLTATDASTGVTALGNLVTVVVQ